MGLLAQYRAWRDKKKFEKLVAVLMNKDDRKLLLPSEVDIDNDKHKLDGAPDAGSRE